MCFCICNGGVQRTAATRYLDYLDYLDYLSLLSILRLLRSLRILRTRLLFFNKVSTDGSGRLVGPMRINHYLLEALAISSTVCYTHHFHIGQIGACASGRNWHHSVLHAQGGQHLSRSSLRFQAQWCWRESMMVCLQFCPEVGNQSIKRRETTLFFCNVS